MEGLTIGKMLEGESPFDAAAAMEAMKTWEAAADPFGDLFPEGTETGYDTAAKQTVWSDREGFEAALAAWAEAVDAAIAETGAGSIRDMGKVMAALKAKFTGQMDFGAVGPMVKAKLG